jgi:type I restriction-modification system DNA methylase subunit
MRPEDIGKNYESILEKEVRKEGGIYYTPEYIVDYIVENTVGKLLEGKTPKETERIKIVDPACGGGIFLLGAYQYLLDWHRKYYTEHNAPSKGRRTDPLMPDGQLTIEEKKRILANNIFGVDLMSMLSNLQN